MALGQRRNSMDVWGDFDIFISDFEENRHRMKEIVSQLNGICERRSTETIIVLCSARLIEERTLNRLLALSAGLLLLLKLKVQERYKLAFVAAVGAVWAGRFLYDKMCDALSLMKAKKLVSEFLEKVQALKEELKAVKTSLTNQNRNAEVLVRTEAQIQDLFSSVHVFTSESTEWRLLQVSQQCRKTVEEMEQLWSELLFMREALSENL